MRKLAIAISLLAAAPALAQSATPSLLVILDSSGSMTWSLAPESNQSFACGTSGWFGQETWGDGSKDLPGKDVNGDGLPNDSRLFIAKAALGAFLAQASGINFGLMRYHQDEGAGINGPSGSGCENWYRIPGQEFEAGTAGTLNYSGYGDCSAGGDVLEPIGSSKADILTWIDGVESYPANKEIRADGATPIAGALQTAAAQFTTGDTCHGDFVLLITDGEETCGGDPVAAAAALLAKGVKTFVVGFGPSVSGSATLDRVAQAGGTAGYNGGKAFFAGDPVSLQGALAVVLATVHCDEPCVNDSQCPSPDVCQQGHCGPPCTTDPECPGGQCVSGHCGYPCTTDPQCPSPEVCTNGICSPPCTTDPECPGGQCVSGHCAYVPPDGGASGGCVQDSDCPGEVCVSGRCGPPCTSDPECPGGVCVSGHCATGCTSNAQCTAGSCVSGHCARTCSVEQPCPAGMTCSSGVCIGSPTDPCSVVICPSGTKCQAGACLGDGSTQLGKPKPPRVRQSTGGGCGCTTPGAGALALLGALCGVRRRRRGAPGV